MSDISKKKTVVVIISIILGFVACAFSYCAVSIFSFYSNRYVYLAIGDSITYGEGNGRKSYADCIAKKHNDIYMEKISLGGLRAKELRAYADNGYIDIDKTPDLVTIFVGTNDYGTNISLLEFEKDIESLMQIVKKKYPNSKIVFLTPLYRDYFGNRTNIIPDMINQNGDSLYEYRDVIKKKAIEKGIDFYELTEKEFINKDNLRELTYDGLHPNKKGYELIADKLYEDLIEKDLAQNN